MKACSSVLMASDARNIIPVVAAVVGSNSSGIHV